MTVAPVRQEAPRLPAPELSVVARPRRLTANALALSGIYLVAVAYYWFQSRAHVTPAVFGDELLYSKLAQSVAAGHGFVLRGEHVFFPAPLAILVQAPAWLFQATPTAFGVAKAINVAVMSTAVFPAYCLARRLTRPSYALLASAATVAGPAMLYAPYLMSEALAYPVFLLAAATMTRALVRPGRAMEAAVVAVSLLAVLTRVQFVVVPVAYLVAVAARRRLRAHALSAGALITLCVVPLATGGVALGSYAGAATLDFDPLAVLRWTGWTAALIPFVAGWLIVPGALLGFVLLAVRPRNAAEASFGALALALSALVLLETGLVAAGEANRMMERYAIYLIPLAAIGFFAYAERGAPWRKVYGAVALAGGCAAWLVDFPVRAGALFAFDTPTFSVYAQTAVWLGHANAATIFAGVPLAAGIVLALLPLRGRAVSAIGVTAIALMLVSGAAAEAGDHAMTRGALEARAGDPPDWLDRSGLGPADFLELPEGSAHYGWLLETWNRDFGRPIRLGLATADGYPTQVGSIDREGRLLVDGRPVRAGTLVVNDYGTAIELEGRVVARPRHGLTTYRVPVGAHVRTLAQGVFFDRWAEAVVRVRSWPLTRGASYRVVLALPKTLGARTVTLNAGAGSRTITLLPGSRRVVRIPASAPLEIRTDRADYLGAGTADARLVALRVPHLSYVEKRSN